MEGEMLSVKAGVSSGGMGFLRGQIGRGRLLPSPSRRVSGSLSPERRCKVQHTFESGAGISLSAIRLVAFVVREGASGEFSDCHVDKRVQNEMMEKFKCESSQPVFEQSSWALN
jgi:hypothetical protein